MMPCERCGASNQPQSRFCVSCGSPMPAAQQPAPRGPGPAHSPPPGPQQWSRPAAPHYAPGHPSQPAIHHQPAPSPQGPPSSGLPFAETAAPPSRDEHNQVHRARQAALGGGAAPAHGYGQPAYPGHGSGSMPAPAYPTNPPAPGAQPQATAAMPGVAQDPALVAEGAPRILSGFLVSYEGEPLGTFWPIYQGRNVIGREGAPIHLDIRIAHPTTSSRHAVLMASALPGRVKLEDLGSTNGTFVNDARLGQGQPVELSDGDRVRLGLFSAVVKIV